MPITRRTLLLAAAGLVAGCTPHQRGLRPGPRWPEQVSAPHSPGRQPDFASQPDRNPDHASSQTASDLGAIPRSRWTRHHARPNHVNAMNGVNRITIHHEGWKTVYFTDYQKTTQRLERIRHSHVNNHGWGDIGYHFVIDRAGRVWEARDLKYQGAHVSDNNPHNIGVMMLGNFQKQYPSQQQLNALKSFVQKLMNRYHVPAYPIHPHRELGQTSCPGQYLQPEVQSYRRNGTWS